MAASTELEIQLLRKSVGALEAGRHRCADCGRTPLTGERVYVFEGDRAVCELCRSLRREDHLACVPVRDEAGPHVRVRSRAA